MSLALVFKASFVKGAFVWRTFFFIICLRLGSLCEAFSPNSDLGRAQKSLGTADLAILAQAVKTFLKSMSF